MCINLKDGDKVTAVVVSELRVVTVSGLYGVPTSLRPAVVIQVVEPPIPAPLRVLLLEGETIPERHETVTAIVREPGDGQIHFSFEA